MTINESINHMIYFFRKKLDQSFAINMQGDRLSAYQDGNYFVSPVNEEVGEKTEKPAHSSCGMIPILDLLDNLNVQVQEGTHVSTRKPTKPTKFITIVCIRQEEDKCKDTIETLRFAHQISSTSQPLGGLD
jgi:hypothetical protein